jgi:hypothetical protein
MGRVFARETINSTPHCGGGEASILWDVDDAPCGGEGHQWGWLREEGVLLIAGACSADGPSFSLGTPARMGSGTRRPGRRHAAAQ